MHLARLTAQVLLASHLLLFGSAQAQEKTQAAPPPTEAFFKRPAVNDVALSPSGRRLAISTEVQGRQGLFVFDLQAGELVPQRAALFNDADIREFDWVDDERLVFSVVDLQTGLGEDYRTAPGLFAVRFDGTQLRVLVERRGRSVVGDGSRISTLPWNHVLLHVPLAKESREGARADEVLMGEMQFADKDLQSISPLWLNTRTGRTRSLDVDGTPAGAQRWWFSAAGQPRALTTVRKGREALHWYEPPRDGQAGHAGQPGRWRLLAEAPLDQLPFFPVWVGEGEQLFVSTRRGAAGEEVVARFDFATGQPGEALVLTPGFDFRGAFVGSQDGRRLLGVRTDTDAEQTHWFDPAYKAMQQRVDAALPGRVNRISCRRCGSDDAVVLVRSWSDRHSGELLLLQPGANEGKGRWQRISRQMPGINPEQMAPVALQRIQARDGRDLPLWITRPAKASGPLPTVMLVHGGPWVRQGHWRWEPMRQLLASRGYLVIEPEFRGSDGYGLAHLKAGYKQFGLAMQTDVADALLWAQAQGLASDKACITGASYGGYSTLMGLIRQPELYRCGSAQVAVADLMLYVDGSWRVEDDISDLGREHILSERVGHPERDRALLLANSPVELAAQIRAPLQLIWGSDDRRVPIAHGRRLKAAMEKAGLKPEWIVYEGEAHGWRKTDNQVDMANKLLEFLDRHLKPAAQP